MPSNQSPRGPLRREGRSASFHGRTKGMAAAEPQQMRRPKTHPDLLGGARVAAASTERRVPTKVVVNVTVQRSLGPVLVMASTDWTVEELIAAALKQYQKEGRRPLLPTTVDPTAFSLHYSQFSLENLDPKEKLIGLGSRNFFLCPKQRDTTATSADASASVQTLRKTCSGEAAKVAKKAKKAGIPWLGFMDFLL